MNTTTTTTAPTIIRDGFGAIDKMPADMHATAQALLKAAIAAGKLDDAYNAMTWDKRYGYTGWCLSYAIYDVTPAAVLVQRRETERTRFGTSPNKSYYIVRRCGKGVTVTEAPKARVVKLAKVATGLGEVIDTLEGRAKTPLKQPAPFDVKETAFKIVEARGGTYWSVFDEDFEWQLGRTRIEAASADHKGGYYVFPSVEAAKKAFEQQVVFNEAWLRGKHLVLIECEISGRRYQHDNGKVCASFCRPVRLVDVQLIEQLEAA